MKLGTIVTGNKGAGYWDVTKHPYGGDFKRFTGKEVGQVIEGQVKMGDEVRIKLLDGRAIVASEFDVKELSAFEVIKAIYESNRDPKTIDDFLNPKWSKKELREYISEVMQAESKKFKTK